MYVAFVNTFERVANGGVDSGQLTIGEERGVWLVTWLQKSEGGNGTGEDEQTVWFEGASWEEMIAAFRQGVAQKMGEGYTPIIDGMLEDAKHAGGGFLSMLQCYGELHANAELYQMLREWRRTVAAAERKSAYLVATNKMLSMISAYLPHTKEELAQIPGWGDRKNAEYGDAVVGMTAGFARTTSFPLEWVSDALDSGQYTSWMFRQKELKYKGVLHRQQENRRIIEAVHEGTSLKELERELGVPSRELLIRLEELERNGYDIDPFIERELAVVPEDERQKIWATLEALGDRFLKPILAEVYGTPETAVERAPIEQLYERLRLMRIRYRRSRAV